MVLYFLNKRKKNNVLLVVYRKSTAKLLSQDLAAFSKIKKITHYVTYTKKPRTYYKP